MRAELPLTLRPVAKREVWPQFSRPVLKIPFGKPQWGAGHQHGKGGDSWGKNNQQTFRIIHEEQSMNKNKNTEEEEESSSLILISSPRRISLPPHQYFREERETLCSCRGNLEGLKIHPVLSKAFSRCWNHLIPGGWPAQFPFPMAGTGMKLLEILLSEFQPEFT